MPTDGLCESPCRRDSVTGSRSLGPGLARSARTWVAELPHRELPTSGFKSNSAMRVNLKARSGALLPAQFNRGRTGRPPLKWLSPAAPLCSSGIATYRLRSPAAAAAAPQPKRTAAAILVRVRRRRTDGSPTPPPRAF